MRGSRSWCGFDGCGLLQDIWSGEWDWSPLHGTGVGLVGEAVPFKPAFKISGRITAYSYSASSLPMVSILLLYRLILYP